MPGLASSVSMFLRSFLFLTGLSDCPFIHLSAVYLCILASMFVGRYLDVIFVQLRYSVHLRVQSSSLHRTDAHILVCVIGQSFLCRGNNMISSIGIG